MRGGNEERLPELRRGVGGPATPAVSVVSFHYSSIHHYNADVILMSSFPWTNPSAWPWFIWVWVAFVLAGWVKPAWNAYRRHRVGSWPSVLGRIEAVRVAEPKRILGLTLSQNPTYDAQIAYSYGVQGQTYSGLNRRTFAEQEEANDFLRDLKDRPVTVHYNPAKPEVSAVTETSLQDVLKSRLPVPLSASATQAIPRWARPFVAFFMGASIVGLVLSLYVHINALMGHSTPGAFWALHAGIFVVWFPAVVVAVRRAGKKRGRDMWKVILNGAPVWMRYILYALFAYPFLGLVLSMGNAAGGPSGMENPAQWRGFSQTWMVFYFAAFAILYAALKDARPHCVNGHVVSPNTVSCPRCGQAVLPG